MSYLLLADFLCLPAQPLCMLLVSVCTQAISRSSFPLWSWRAMRLCGWRRSANTKCALPSALTQSWRCAPRAWVHRQKHCGSVCLFSCLMSHGKQQSAAFSSIKFKEFSSMAVFFSLWCCCHSNDYGNKVRDTQG